MRKNNLFGKKDEISQTGTSFPSFDFKIVISAAVFLTAIITILFIFLLRPKAKPTMVHESHPAVSSRVTVLVPNYSQNIADAKKNNPDTIGWLNVPNTSLNMAVVQTKDNAYYLKHNFKKDGYWRGWPFLDYRDKLTDAATRHLIIYGHNMGDGLLFGQLKKYKDINYLNKNPVIYFSTQQGNYQWKIFSVYVTDVNFYYIRTNFSSDNDFGGFIKELRTHSLYNTTVDVTPQDTILTFSTCTYEFKDARFVIHARRVRPGEGLTVSPATNNPNPASPHNLKRKSS